MKTIQPPDTLIFTWGNPSRGDDALGPLIYEQLLQESFDDVELLTDFQLQIEHAVDLDKRQRILFVDASVSAAEPFDFYPVHAMQDDSYSTHAVSPQSLLSVYEKINQRTAPPAYMLSVRGFQFGLGLPLSEKANANLGEALTFIRLLLTEKTNNWPGPVRAGSSIDK